MAKKNNGAKMNTDRIPLEFAKRVSDAANVAFDGGRGQMMEKVSLVTQKLLKFWFVEPFTTRTLNFHEGQRQAILNVIYLHEVLGCENIRYAYEKIGSDLLANDGMRAEVEKSKYSYQKYLVKMATGTGKTWVMHALLIWQYLNARHSGKSNGKWTKNFLFVAPGLIVYERLLDAFCGKRIMGGENRDFATSDIKSCEALFVPPEYRSEIYAFLQNCVVRKEEFGRKVTGDGVLAVMNWHTFLAEEEIAGTSESGDDSDGKGIFDDLLPARPGTAAGNALDALDAKFLRGSRLDFLKELPDLMLVNDEAHHIHGARDEDAVKWQRGIDLLAERLGTNFKQLDFSATPYVPSGSGERMRENYFPHIVVDYDLVAAIKGGKVKTIVIDQRKAICNLQNLDYSAVREGRNVVGLSEGQRLMLRAGLRKLAYLEGEFARLDENKHPKMMVVCEDTQVTPFVERFLVESEGLGADDVLTIDSNRQGEINEKDWAELKGRLFAVDRQKSPKVIVSVLMLREGFDVNNICVIVPLRATGAQILLEQTLGRGLRLMWREPEYQQIKDEARRQLLVEHVEPNAVLDMLFIIEHPAFIGFYNRYLENGLIASMDGEDCVGKGTGDFITAHLKENYGDYDLFWPVVLRDSEEIIEPNFNEEKLEPFTAYSLEQLRRFFAKDGEMFVGREMLVQTSFGEYKVHANLFNATSYNEYLQRLINVIFRRFRRINGKQTKVLPAMQINLAQIAEIIDRFIRNGLFGEPFDPFNGSDWKILMVTGGVVTEHIVKVIGGLVYAMECGTVTTKALVDKRWFSEVKSIALRKSEALELRKTIYDYTGYISNRGGLERAFLEFVDRDGGVRKFIKINEHKYPFVKIAYLRKDGLLGGYIPDFIVATDEGVYLVETKGQDKIHDEDVERKRLAAIKWCEEINKLATEERMDLSWTYLLVSERDFYLYRDAGATFKDIVAKFGMSENEFKGELTFE